MRWPDEHAEQSKNRLVALKVAMLRGPLDGLPLSDYERRVLSRVGCWEAHSVAALAGCWPGPARAFTPRPGRRSCASGWSC